MVDFWNMLTKLDTIGWVFLCGVVWIVMEGIVTIIKMRIKHAERMAMIEQGINPGAPEKAYEKDEV